MAKSRSRGGYRKPTPNRKNAVSGPGALSQRTDGAQPIMRGEDMAYGESAAFQQQQQGAPGGLPAPQGPPSVAGALGGI